MKQNSETLFAVKRNAVVETLFRILFFVAALASILAVALICIFLFANGRACHG